MGKVTILGAQALVRWSCRTENIDSDRANPAVCQLHPSPYTHRKGLANITLEYLY